MGLSISEDRTASGVLVSVEGEVDVSNAPELREAIDEALQHAAEYGATLVEVALDQVPYIDSTGIGVLVGVVHRASEAGVQVRVLNPQRNVARVLALLGLDGELGVTYDGRA